MAHGLKTGDFCRLRHLVAQGAARVPQIVNRGARAARANRPTDGFLRFSACGTLLSGWRKGGARCRSKGAGAAPIGIPLKGYSLVGGAARPQVHLQGGAGRMITTPTIERDRV